MMKKHLFLRLCLMFLVGVSAFSCRTEEFHNEEEAHGNTGLRLTSKRISLNEAKHKTQLLTEIDKAENTLKGFTKMNVHGKVVNYGNGVSIDTDHVIYIENGPNYHTYTFHITRDNAPANAPLENLLLSPLPDGSYQEFLVTYNLTALEKQKLLNGEPVNTKGKTTITELAKGTFNSGGQLARKTCGWGEETIWQSCSEGVHNASNIELWHTCKASVPPKVYTVAAWVCTSVAEPQPEHIAAPENGGGGAGGGSGTGSPTQDCTTAATDPSQVGLVSPTGCLIGVPTEPIVRPNANPCEKTKALLASPDVQMKIDLMKEKSKIGGEIGVNIKADGTTSGIILGGDHEVEMGDTAGYQGGYHNHTPTGIKMLSPPDIQKLLTYALAQPNGNISNAFFGMVGSEPCTGSAPSCENGFMYHNYIIRFSGTITELTEFIYNNNWDIKSLIRTYQRRNINLSKDTNYVNYKYGSLNSNGLQKLFFETLKNMGMEGKITLQRVDHDGTIQNITENNNGGTTATPCP